MKKKELSAMLEPKCRPIAERMGFELLEVALEKEPGGSYLRFYIDKPDGITLDDCESFHKEVRPLTENCDFDFMEVSSPGIDRPLKTDRDFERNLGAEVEVHLFRPLDGTKELRGILAGLENGIILLSTPEGKKRIERKAASLVRPWVDLEGIEDVDLSEDGSSETDSTEA